MNTGADNGACLVGETWAREARLTSVPALATGRPAPKVGLIRRRWMGGVALLGLGLTAAPGVRFDPAAGFSPGAVARAASTDGEPLYAFANASPLTVVESPGSKNSRKEEFEFGAAYRVEGQELNFLRVKLKSGRMGYVRSEEVTTVSKPRWLSSTAAYNGSERPRTVLWNDPAALRELLAGAGTAKWSADYEESFTEPPQFRLKLPLVESDDVAVRGGERRVKYAEALLPVSREEREAFESAKSELSQQINLYLLLDVSGSTKGFLEPVVRDLAKAIDRNRLLRSRLTAASVVTFGADRKSVVSNLGKLALKQIADREWHASGDEKTTTGEREPLVDGLAALTGEPQVSKAETSVIRKRYESTTAPGGESYVPRLKRIGIQNWRRASTVAGMSRQPCCASSGIPWTRVGGSAGWPASSTQWIRIGRSRACSALSGESSRDQTRRRSFMTA